MELSTRSLYSFLGVHSFLIGLFPFYIPVYLYKAGFFLHQISCFIAVTGAGFVISLYLWDRISKIISLRYLIIFSFFSEFILMSLFFLNKDMSLILSAGFFNGVFNCSFWIIQRFLFLETITTKNSGKKFGNFQIFVLVVLKAGIFAGGIMLEKSGYLYVYIFSAAIAMAAALFFFQREIKIELDEKIVSAPPLGFKFIAGYKDKFNSRTVFAVDGIFLYLESYCWMISLFIIVRENFWRLGVLVIFLMALFGGIFVMIKNRIDLMPKNKIYNTAVCLYSLSWILRSVLSNRLNNVILIILLGVITFCTSIFRLSFNKRFFDIAKSAKSHEYILMKSYFSQFFLAIAAFAGFNFLLADQSNTLEQLSMIYLAAGFASFIYLVYNENGFK